MESTQESAIKVMNQDFVKLDKLDGTGTNFNRWKDKLMFFLTALKVAYIFNPNLSEIPAPAEGESEEVTKQRQKREEDEIICRDHILNTLSDSYYDMFQGVRNPRKIWAAIEREYTTQKQGTDKFLIKKYFEFKLADSFSLMDQIHNLQVIVSKLKDYGVEVLNLSKIEEGARILQKLEIDNASKTNMVEEKMNSGSKRKRPENTNSKDNKKKNRNCYNCGKKCHYKAEHKLNKKQKKNVAPSANLVDECAEIVAMMTFGTLTELHMTTPTSSKDWWYDSGAAIHVCNEKNQFKSYELLEGHEVVMANGVRAKVHGKGDVHLQFTSGKKLILTNVLHVHDVVKNLVSTDILNKKGLKAVLESNNVILSKNDVFVGKGYSCNGMFKVPDNKRTKLGPRALKSVIVGYAENSKAYGLLDLGSNIIVESRDVEFFEYKFFKDSTVTISPSSPNATSSSDIKTKEIDTPSEPRRSQRQRKEKQLPPDFVSLQAIVFLVEGNRDFLLNKTPILLNVEDDPKTYDEATKSSDAAFWKEAVNDEIDSILSNNTWVLVELPQGSKPIGCKWVFRKKYATNGTILAYKARLVAKGYRQKEGIDYFDTYAPMVRITSVRVLLVLASVFSFHVHQMDVKTDFLNGDLNEEVYMNQPEGFVLSGNEHKVCKLVKFLYGLKQAPKQWHEKFESVLLSSGFRYNNADKCIYSKSNSEYNVIICLYVNDMLIVSATLKGVVETKKYLSSKFKMKDLGEVDTILGIKVKRHSEGFCLVSITLR
ncbi:uncharacterized protein [Coffea arabica]|uniref:Reverse transcriptase Ty1/copia-type domain-containing protein n=1 Tax=Coffea arabica TaxID=13443 RepID=A0ABM4W916_COFAR